MAKAPHPFSLTRSSSTSQTASTPITRGLATEGTSAAELLQEQLPNAKVVKALNNTLFAAKPGGA